MTHRRTTGRYHGISPGMLRVWERNRASFRPRTGIPPLPRGGFRLVLEFDNARLRTLAGYLTGRPPTRSASRGGNGLPLL